MKLTNLILLLNIKCFTFNSIKFIAAFKGKYFLTSKPADFDPCHLSVRFKIPKSKKPPPLVIGIGGGGGRKDAERLMNFLYKNGFATIEFDTYQMNGISNYFEKGNSIKYGKTQDREN